MFESLNKIFIGGPCLIISKVNGPYQKREILSKHCKRFVRENPCKKQCSLVHRDFDRSYSCHKQYWQKQVFLFSYILQVLSISVKNTVKDRILIQSSDLNFTDLTMNFSWKSKLIYLHFALKYPDISRKFLCQKFLKGWQMKWSLYLVLCTEGCSSARSS